MQALKQAARENDAVRMEALCETWSLPAGNTEQGIDAPVGSVRADNPVVENAASAVLSETSEIGRK
jgi:hypothetical protein